jgi:hypothetical protein
MVDMIVVDSAEVLLADRSLNEARANGSATRVE